MNNSTHSTTIPPLPLRTRLLRFVTGLALLLAIVYGGLPLLTRSVPVLQRMSVYLSKNGIDPSRYFYTDVEAVGEAEKHMQEVMQSVTSEPLQNNESHTTPAPK